ncbi:MAG: hypothetical protein WBV28_13215 [Terracidiphilus sp.]
MDLAFFSPTDRVRAELTLRKIAMFDVSRWAITGGLAIEIHLYQHAAKSFIRPLQDIDFMTASFDEIPNGLAKDLLFRHIHPHDPPGRNLLQGVDPVTNVRVDVFRAYGLEMERVAPVTVAGMTLRMVSLEDMIARHARLSWDLLEGNCVAPKFARDFLRMIDLVPPDAMESIWLEHRKPRQPQSFGETVMQLRQAIATRSDLLVSPIHSTDVHSICLRCETIENFPLADASRILSILGYC